MKKIIIITLLIITLPLFVVLFFTTTTKENLNLKYIKNNQFVRVKDEKINQIINVPLEEYVLGVVAGEMPVSFEIEALKAQAVASRSYVLSQILSNKENEYDVVNTTTNQVYLTQEQIKDRFNKNYEKNIKKLQTVVNDTSGEYLEYKGEIVSALFFSTSSGYTENSEEVFSSSKPYLRSVDSSWDKEVSPVFKESNSYSLKEFYQKLNLPYSDILKVEILETTSTGRIKKIKLNNTEFNASEIRSKLNLKSTFFEIKQNDNNIEIETKGFGHGVGMSQYGAQAMALKKYSYDKILKYYYTNVEIKKI